MALDMKKVAAMATAATVGAVALWSTQQSDPQPLSYIPQCVSDTVCELPCVDRETTTARFCLTCHDGSVATPISGHYNFGEELGNHPYDADYYAGQMRRELGLYPQPRDPALVLVDGKLVTCTTCHNYWALPRRAGWASVPTERLCTDCHDK